MAEAVDATKPPGLQKDSVYQRKVDMPLSDVFKPEVLQRLQPGQTAHENGLDVHYDQNDMSVTLQGKWESDSLTLFLNRDGTRVVKVSNGQLNSLHDSIAHISKYGILNDRFIRSVGIGDRELANIKAEGQRESRQLEIMTQSQVTSLPSIARYTGSADKTATVNQGTAEIIDLNSNKRTQGLYTFGAWPCEILILTERGINGSPERIGLAHIDSRAEEKDIRNYVSMMGDPKRVSATVISGERKLSLKTEEALRHSGVTIQFAAANINGLRFDAAAVDRNGVVYYGSRQEFQHLPDPSQSNLGAGDDRPGLQIKFAK